MVVFGKPISSILEKFTIFYFNNWQVLATVTKGLASVEKCSYKVISNIIVEVSHLPGTQPADENTLH